MSTSLLLSDILEQVYREVPNEIRDRAMPEEQESLSLSDTTTHITNTDNSHHTANTSINVAGFGNRDNVDNSDDTIKIQRVKLPLHEYQTVEVDKNGRADAIHQSPPENGNSNGHGAATDALHRFHPEEQPFFEELALEKTAKLPIPQSEETSEYASGKQIAANDGVIEHTYEDVQEEAVQEIEATPSDDRVPEQDIDDEDVEESQPPLSTPLQISSAPPSIQLQTVPAPLRPVVRLWKFSRLLCTGILLIPVLAVCFYAYTQLNRFQNELYTVDAQTGAALWQHPDSGTDWTGVVDEQGNIQVVTLPGNEQQLVAFDTQGTLQWQSFSVAGVFALPTVQVAPGTILATLSQQTALGQSLTLYSFNRATGHINWQYAIAQPAQTQSRDILGADHNFIFALTTQLLANGQRQVQLLAINQYTGYIGWRVNSPAEGEGNPIDTGTLLLTGEDAVWQVDATIEVIEETQGNMLWSTDLPFNTFSMLPQEAQMVVVRGQLVIERNDTLHAFDLATGKSLWDTEVFDFSAGATPVPVVAANQAVLVYGNGQLAAISLTGQHIIWQQRQTGTILGLHVSDDGTLIYAIILDSVEDSPPAQALLAFDAQNGAARWTFQLSDQYSFLHPQSDGFQYHHNVILTTLCVTASCSHPHLYALNATTGAILWKFEGNSVSHVRLSTDGSSVSYEGNTSAWQQFIAGLSG